MSDEFDVIHLDQDDVQEVINWAVAAAAMVILMRQSPQSDDANEELDRLARYTHALDIIWRNLPDVLVSPATVIAEESINDAIAEEEEIERFRDELKDL